MPDFFFFVKRTVRTPALYRFFQGGFAFRIEESGGKWIAVS
jgi:hypothetical protein